MKIPIFFFASHACDSIDGLHVKAFKLFNRTQLSYDED